MIFLNRRDSFNIILEVLFFQKGKEVLIMNKYNVVVTGRLLEPALEKLLKYCDAKLWKKTGPIPQNLMTEWLRGAEGLLSIGNITINEQLLSNAIRLRVVAQATVGYDNIEIDACTRRGIPVGSTPGVSWKPQLIWRSHYSYVPPAVFTKVGTMSARGIGNQVIIFHSVSICMEKHWELWVWVGLVPR